MFSFSVADNTSEEGVLENILEQLQQQNQQNLQILRHLEKLAEQEQVGLRLSYSILSARDPGVGPGGGPRVVVSTAAFHEFGVRFPVSAV